jgi:peptidoglycan/xylan/chitin deacetylase (PgdA/CDA1 family)
MYHSVDDRGGRFDTWGLSVAPQNFSSQIEALTSERTVVPLEDLAHCVCIGRVPRGLVSITFDDGYANNATIALPVLERYSAPATLFYMTAAGDTPSFWWDRLERIVTEAQALPAHISIPLAERQVEIDTEGVDRREAHIRIWSRLRVVEPEERERALVLLGDLLGAVPLHDPALRPLTIDDVACLDGGIFSIGGHTHTHPSLPSLGKANLAREIAGSKALCDRRLSRQIAGFAYPFGDFSDDVKEAVADAGFKFACTTAARAVRPDDDALALPRIAVGDWSGDELMRQLRGYEDSWQAGREMEVTLVSAFAVAGRWEPGVPKAPPPLSPGAGGFSAGTAQGG